MKTSNKLYSIQRLSYRFRIAKNKQVNTCFLLKQIARTFPWRRRQNLLF